MKAAQRDKSNGIMTNETWSSNSFDQGMPKSRGFGVYKLFLVSVTADQNEIKSDKLLSPLFFRPSEKYISEYVEKRMV